VSLLHRAAAALGLIEHRSQAQGGGTPPGVLPPPRDRGVTARDALSLPAVYRAISILATSAGQLSLGTFRGDEPTTAPTYVVKPDLNTSRSAFLQHTVTCMAAAGNAYWRVDRNQAGEVRNLSVVDPWRVAIDTTAGLPSYSIDGQPVHRAAIRHLPLLRVPSSPYGLGPIQAARIDVAGALDLRDYAANWFESGTVPNGVLSSDQRLTDEDARTAKERWTESVNGRTPAVLGAGLSYAPMLIPPRDAQWLESRQFTTTELARLFGIPATYMLAAVEGNSMTYQNMEQVDISFVRYTLMQYLREIEEAFTSLMPHTQVARFNVEVLLRTDTRARYEAHKTAIDAEIYTAEYARKIEGIQL